MYGHRRNNGEKVERASRRIARMLVTGAAITPFCDPLKSSKGVWATLCTPQMDSGQGRPIINFGAFNVVQET